VCGEGRLHFLWTRPRLPGRYIDLPLQPSICYSTSPPGSTRKMTGAVGHMRMLWWEWGPLHGVACARKPAKEASSAALR
jgi:hypothetical protein